MELPIFRARTINGEGYVCGGFYRKMLKNGKLEYYIQPYQGYPRKIDARTLKWKFPKEEE